MIPLITNTKRMTKNTYLILADIEGVSGFVDWKQEEYEVEFVRQAMASDVNAAIEGILMADGEKCEIIVTDGHGHKLSIPSDELHPSASLIRGGPREWGLVSGIKDNPDYALFIGAHAHPSSGGLLEHVFRKTAITDIYLNDHPVGELELNSIILDDMNTDIICVTGDNILCNHVKTVLPDTLVVQTKQTLGFNAAKCRTPEAVRDEITNEVNNELQDNDDQYRFQLPLEYPLSVSVTYNQADKAEIGALWPTVERVDSRTIGVECGNPEGIYKFVRAAGKV